MRHNYETCGGPTACAYCRAILSETPEQACARFAEETRGLRSAGASHELRTGVHFQEDTMKNDYAPIDSYAPGIARLRAATASADLGFAERYAAERRRALEAEHAARSVRAAQQPERKPRPRLTAAELRPFAAPNAYQIALDKMKESRS